MGPGIAGEVVFALTSINERQYYQLIPWLERRGYIASADVLVVKSSAAKVQPTALVGETAFYSRA